MSSKNDDANSNNTGTIIEEKIEVKKPSFYQVLIMNDDYTPMEFVILVLERFFKKSRAEATSQVSYYLPNFGPSQEVEGCCRT